MLYPISLLFLNAAWTTSASLIPPRESTHLTNHGLAAGNISPIAYVPDPRFSIAPRYGDRLLPIDPCLMNVLYFMSAVAYEDTTQLLPPQTYRAPGYDQVEIVTGIAMTARFLIWGIWLAIQHMIENSGFRSVIWTLRWDDFILGTINIRASAPHLSIPGSSNVQPLDISSIENGTANLGATVDDPDIPNNSLDLQFTVTVSSFLDAETLTKTEVFIVCYTGLLYCAQKPPARTMRAFDIRSPIDDVSLSAVPRGPGLAYAYIIHTLSHIPRVLLQDPVGFREINVDMKLDGALCATGAITRTRP